MGLFQLWRKRTIKLYIERCLASNTACAFRVYRDSAHYGDGWLFSIKNIQWATVQSHYQAITVYTKSFGLLILFGQQLSLFQTMQLEYETGSNDGLGWKLSLKEVWRRYIQGGSFKYVRVRSDIVIREQVVVLMICFLLWPAGVKETACKCMLGKQYWNRETVSNKWYCMNTFDRGGQSGVTGVSSKYRNGLHAGLEWRSLWKECGNSLYWHHNSKYTSMTMAMLTGNKNFQLSFIRYYNNALFTE